MTTQSFHKAAAIFAFSAIFGAGLVTASLAQDKPASGYQPRSGQAGKDVVWVPTPHELVAAMLDTAKVTKDDTVIDLGSGDGRTVIAAGKRGARAIGIEYNSDMVEFARQNAAREGANVTFINGDIFKTDFSHATVLTLYLLPRLNVQLRPLILDMKPGTRVVSNSFDMAEWQADETIKATGDNCTLACTGYFWIVPAKVGGKWQTAQGELTLTQQFQMLTGNLKSASGAETPVTGRLAGADISLTIGNASYKGRVDGDSLTASGSAGNLQGKRGK